MSAIKRLGVLTGGGDAPGLNAVIRAVVRSATTARIECVGIEDSFDGLFDPKHTRVLTVREVTGILRLGGTILGTTNRGNPFGAMVDADGAAVDYSDRVIENVRSLGLDALVVIGGDGTLAIAHRFQQRGVPIVAVPKTIDNDIADTSMTFGFDTAVAFATEALDRLHATAEAHHRVMVAEVMGRHAGWIAAAAGLAQETPDGAPHIIVFPEIAFEQATFIKKVDETVRRAGYCVIVVSEGARRADGAFLAEAGTKDAFGHTQLGGVAPTVAEMVRSELGYKFHWAVADYLQRAARHIASATDVEQAYAVGRSAVEFAVAGKNAVMPIIVRKSSKPYRWTIGEAPLAKVANVEKKMPRNFITRDGFGITQKAREYLQPLIAGEDYPRYKSGLPQYVTLKNQLIPKKLGAF